MQLAPLCAGLKRLGYDRLAASSIDTSNPSSTPTQAGPETAAATQALSSSSHAPARVAWHAAVLPLVDMLPAACQGVVGITAHADNAELLK